MGKTDSNFLEEVAKPDIITNDILISDAKPPDPDGKQS